jgi:homogentisate 1,2-dioxygenase
MTEYEEIARLKNNHRSWYYRLRQSLDLFHLAESDWQAWRHRVGDRLGNYDIIWTKAISAATLEELQDLDVLRNEKRSGR